jgi:hypothetical protein
VKREADETAWGRLMGWLAALLPFALAVWRSAGAPQWCADLGAIRDQGLASVSFGGALSTVATQLGLLLPLGARSFRAAVASAAAIALGSWLLYGVGRRLIAATGAAPRLTALLAAVGALTASLGSVWQAEATVPSGAGFAVVALLAGVELTLRLADPEQATLTPRGTTRWLLLGAIGGAVLAENVPAAVALLVVSVATFGTAGRRPSLRLVPTMLLVALATAASLSAPLLLRPFAPHGWADVGRAISNASLTALGLDASRGSNVARWVVELGTITLLGGAVGIGAGAFRERQRVPLTVIVILPLLDLVYPTRAARGLGADPLLALHAAAIGALGLAAALGVAETVMFLHRLRVPLGRTAAVLTVVFHMTVVAVTCEEAGLSSDRSDQVAAEQWTDRALGELPAGAAVLVHSPPLAWRLWAAQLLDGQRPDVLVLAAPLLRRGVVMAHWVPAEPDVTPLLRDFALTGKASEYGLSVLADARPLHVELDQGWDDRVMSHLGVAGTWLRFAPESLGRSDREASVPSPLAADRRLASRLPRGALVEEPTTQVVARTLKEHAVALSLLGMGESTGGLLDGIDQLLPGDPFVVTARLRLDHAARAGRGKRAVELRDLLRF